MTDEPAELGPCRRARCPGTYERAGFGRGPDDRVVVWLECDRCGDLQQHAQPEPPTIPLFTEIQ